MFVGLEVILGYFPACREAQALLIAIQLCAHCLGDGGSGGEELEPSLDGNLVKVMRAEAIGLTMQAVELVSR